MHSHTRNKRDVEPPESPFYKMDAFGSTLHLKLKRNDNLLTPGMTVLRKNSDGTTTAHPAPANTFYHGQVTSDPKSIVAVSNLRGLVRTFSFLSSSRWLRFIIINGLSSSLIVVVSFGITLSDGHGKDITWHTLRAPSSGSSGKTHAKQRRRYAPPHLPEIVKRKPRGIQLRNDKRLPLYLLVLFLLLTTLSPSFPDILKLDDWQPRSDSPAAGALMRGTPKRVKIIFVAS